MFNQKGEARSRMVNEVFQNFKYGGEAITSDLRLAYGETKPSSVEKLFRHFKSRKVFYDLGSGQGKLVLQAAYSNSIKRVVGIEIVPDRYDDSLRALEIAKKRSDFPKNVSVQFIHGDFLTSSFSDGDIIYILATAFDSNMMEDLKRQFSLLKKGARIIIADGEIISPDFKGVGTDRYELDYDNVIVNIYDRV